MPPGDQDGAPGPVWEMGLCSKRKTEKRPRETASGPESAPQWEDFQEQKGGEIYLMMSEMLLCQLDTS